MYILVMLKIKEVEYNQFTTEIYNKIKKYYQNSKPFLGLQLTKWYKKDEKISKCIEEILEETNTNIKECNYEILIYLLKSKKLTEIKKELADYILELILDINKFDFKIYKTICVEQMCADDITEVGEYIISRTNDRIFIKWLDKKIKENTFNELSQFRVLDETVAFYLRHNLLSMQLYIELEEKFNELYDPNGNVTQLNYQIEIERICKINGYDFFKTQTCKETIYSYIFKDGKIIDKDKNLSNILYEYLKLNKKNVLYDYCTFNIINANNIGKISIDNIKDINKTISQPSIEKYKDKITNFIKMNSTEQKEFLLAINNLKLINGIIPYDICKYIIFCILKYDDFSDIKGCILCDFASNIEQEIGIKNVLNYIENENEMPMTYGIYQKSKFIKITEKLVNQFSKEDVKAIDTIYHEIEHSIQHIDIKNKNFTGNRYKMYVEQELSKLIPNYNQFNYYNEYSEIEARKAGAEKLKDFLLAISIGLNDVYVLYDRKKYTANEYINMKLNECEECFKIADKKKIDKDKTEDIKILWEKYKKEC